MQTTFAFLALAAAGIVSAQGVSGVLTPTAAAPAGCSTSYPSSFEITVVTPSKKRDIVQRQSTTCSTSGTLVAKLNNGVLTDSLGRIGSIVANRQFQFDGPPAQAGAIYTGGFSVCNNGSLALGGSAVFYQCVSSNFYNLYDQNVQLQGTGNMCMPVIIDVIPCSAAASGAPVSQSKDGQPTGVSASVVSQKTDGQPTAASATKVSQISDGQPQAQSARPVSQFTDGQIQVTGTPAKMTVAPVSQFTDGQVQATSVAKVSQITDGQIQATSAPKVSQITDGQIQASSAAKVTQISDGQIQATKATLSPVAQITDGQIQNSNATATKSGPTSTFTGAAGMATFAVEMGLAAVGMAAYALL